MDASIICSIVSGVVSILGFIITPIITARLAAKKQQADRLIAEQAAHREQAERDRAQEEIFQVLICTDIKQLCHYALEQGEISMKDLDYIYMLYKKYKGLNGDGFVDSLINRVTALPIV